MKTTIATLALALTSVNAANLRSLTGLSKSDTSLVKALANKYDCNTAGNTLVETLEEINEKHELTRNELTKTCAEQKTANADAENTASGIKNTCLADYKEAPEAAYHLHVTVLEGDKEAVHTKHKKLVSDATKAEADATQPSDVADYAFTKAEGVYNGAIKIRKEKMDEFIAARPAAENGISKVWGTSGTEMVKANDAKTNSYEVGAAARSTAQDNCDKNHADRMVAINADDGSMETFHKLVNDLSDCDVPATTDGTGLIEMKAPKKSDSTTAFIEMKAQAKCAVAQEKATVFLQERLHVDGVADGIADTTTITESSITESFSAYVNRITLQIAHVKAEKGTCYDAALKVETDEKALADTEFGKKTSSIATELKSQTDALNKKETDLDTTTASAVSDAKTPWETTQSAKKSLNNVLAVATADKTTAEGSADVAKKEADDDFEAAIEAALASQTLAITAAKESCDDAWETAQKKKTDDDKANEESCEMDRNTLDEEKKIIDAIKVKVKDLLNKLKDSQKDYKSDESSVTANAVDTATASSPQ